MKLFLTVGDREIPIAMSSFPITHCEARPLTADRTAQTPNKCTQASMPRVGFEPMIPEFGRAKTVDALDRAAIMVGRNAYIQYDIMSLLDQTRCPSNPILDGTNVVHDVLQETESNQ
jgi:hypothetical protein